MRGSFGWVWRWEGVVPDAQWVKTSNLVFSQVGCFGLDTHHTHNPKVSCNSVAHHCRKVSRTNNSGKMYPLIWEALRDALLVIGENYALYVQGVRTACPLIAGIHVQAPTVEACRSMPPPAATPVFGACWWGF